MSEISSKYSHLYATECLVHAEKDTNEIIHDGILLITNFGIVYGKFSNIDPEDTTIASNAILKIRDTLIKNSKENGDTISGDGSVVVLNDAVVKYSNNMTLNMKEIIIFCDQIVGYYPVDLSQFSEQHHQV